MKTCACVYAWWPFPFILLLYTVFGFPGMNIRLLCESKCWHCSFWGCVWSLEALMVSPIAPNCTLLSAIIKYFFETHPCCTWAGSNVQVHNSDLIQAAVHLQVTAFGESCSLTFEDWSCLLCIWIVQRLELKTVMSCFTFDAELSWCLLTSYLYSVHAAWPYMWVIKEMEMVLCPLVSDPWLLFMALYLSYLDTSWLFYTIPLQNKYINGAVLSSLTSKGDCQRLEV